MLSQLPWDKTYLVATWIETLVYGFFLCLFIASVYVNTYFRKAHDVHSQVMFIVGAVMFAIATLHVAMNCYRMVRAFTDFETAPGGAAAWLSNLSPWDHVFKDTLYATQEMIGDAVAIYRCWIIWERSWKIIALPLVLLVVSIISGYSVCGLYTTVVDPNDSVFDHRLSTWIMIFYSVAVVQSFITTGLMSYRIWQAEKRTAAYRAGGRSLRPILWILIESASLQLVAETVLFSLYAANYNCQYLMLEPVTPLVGITFTAITLRITLRAQEPPRTGTSTGRGEQQFGTIGSIPMRHIAISITKDVEGRRDDHAGSGESFVEFEKSGAEHLPSAV